MWIKWRFLPLLGVCLLLACCTQPARPLPADSGVMAADGEKQQQVVRSPGLRVAINRKLDREVDSAVTVEDLQSLTGALDISWNRVRSLEGLQYATGLEELILNNHSVSNLQPVAGLEQLQVLRLGGNQIVDISPLQGMAGLRILELGANPIGDFGPLGSLTGLEELDLKNTGPADLEFVRTLGGLKRLEVSGNPTVDISALEVLAGLETLHLEHLRTKELALPDLPALKALTLRNCGITDLSRLNLSGIESLESLNLEGNAVVDISLLEPQQGLRFLNLRYNQVEDIRPLEKLRNLETVELLGNHFSDFSPLGSLFWPDWDGGGGLNWKERFPEQSFRIQLVGEQSGSGRYITGKLPIGLFGSPMQVFYDADSGAGLVLRDGFVTIDLQESSSHIRFVDPDSGIVCVASFYTQEEYTEFYKPRTDGAAGE